MKIKKEWMNWIIIQIYRYIECVDSKDNDKWYFLIILSSVALQIQLPLFYFRCLVDCGPIVSSSYTLRVSSHCLNSPCEGAKYVWSLETLNDNIWENVPNLANMTATTANTLSMVIKPNYLQSDTKYRLRLQVTSSLRTEGLSVLEFKTADAPYGGHCESSVSEGVSLETEFTFDCIGWQDETGSLTYEFRLNNQQISYGVSSKSASTVLPEGIPEDDYKISVNIVVKNALDVSVVQTLSVKVGNKACLRKWMLNVYHQLPIILGPTGKVWSTLSLYSSLNDEPRICWARNIHVSTNYINFVWLKTSRTEVTKVPLGKIT